MESIVQSKVVKKPNLSLDFSKDSLEKKLLEQSNLDIHFKDLGGYLQNIHFVLFALGKRDISTLYEGLECDPDLEQSKIYLNLHSLLKVYSALILGFKQEDLQNSLPYWLLVSTLIEKQMADDLDQEYLNSVKDQPIADNEEPFYIGEGTLKVLVRYLDKLTKFFNPAIYNFYFPLMNLYIWNDSKLTLDELETFFKHQPAEKQKISPIEHTIQPYEHDNLDHQESKYYSTNVKMNFWIILGASKLL